MKPDQIKALAKQAGGTSHVSQYIHSKTALAEQIKRELYTGQPESEPVAGLCKRADGHFDALTDSTCKQCFPVYAAPVQPESEPRARNDWNKKIRDSVDSLLQQRGYAEDSSARHQLATMNFDEQPEGKGLFIDLIATHEGLAEELARPESEPYAYEYQLFCDDSMGQGWEQRFARKIPIYQTVQNVKPLYAAPVQPDYVPLTVEAIFDVAIDIDIPGSDSKVVDFARAIEKKVRGEK